MKRLIAILMIILSVTATAVIAGDNGINTARIQGYNALKVFVQIKDEQIVTADFLEYSTEHFIIKYRPEDENIIRETAQLFEESYVEASKKYNYSSTEKTVVIIYKDQNEFWNYQKEIQGQAVMGLYNMGTIHVLSPNAYEDQQKDKMKFFENNGPVLHEYIHKVIDEQTGGNIELWLTEGLAVYEEYDTYGTVWAPGFKYERYLSSQEMRDGFMYADEIQSYKQSFDMVKYLIDTYGMEKMQELFLELKNGNDTDDAFKKIYGMTADEFIDSDLYKE